MHSWRRYAVSAVAVAVLLAIAGLVVSLSTATAGSAGLLDDALSAAVVASFTITGAVVALARPSNRVGWMMLAAASLWALGQAGVDAARYGLVNAPGTVPAVAWCAVGGSALRGVGWLLVVVGVPMWFPDGRLSGPGWRWLPRALTVAVVCSTVGVVTAQDANITTLHGWQNPTALPHPMQPVSALLSFLAVAVGVAAGAGVVCQLHRRYRRGDPLLRQQLLLFALAAAVPLAAAPMALATGTGTWLFSACALPLPFAIAVAVLARGLYDLRTAVNRTLVWLTLSAAAAGCYVVIVLGVGSRFDIRDTTWLPWVAAAVAAMIFAPLRNGLQRAVNRLTFGRWDQPHQVLAGIGAQLQAAAEARGLLADLVDEMSALGLGEVTVTDGNGTVIAAAIVQNATGSNTTYSADGNKTVTTSTAAAPRQARHDGVEFVSVPLIAYGSAVGILRYRGMALRPRDQRLLDDIAGHLAGVLQVQLLTQELQNAVERLVLAREEERRRLRRDLHDGLGPALAGHLLRLDAITATLERGGSVLGDITTLRAELQDTLLDIRRLVEGLRPPALDELGLANALEQATRRLTVGTNLIVELQVAPLPPLPAAVEVATYRIVTEALTNTVRHAQATVCEIHVLITGARLRITVHDNGHGVQKPDGETHVTTGHGLHTMRERAEELRGQLQLSSHDNIGTTVVAELPLAATPQLDRHHPAWTRP